MSTNIENRVVKMTFDNAQFERGVKETMKTIEEFEKKLDLQGATAGFDKLKGAADKLNLSNIGEQADDAKEKLDNLGSSASDSIDNINKAADETDMSGISDSAQKAATDTQNAIDDIDMSSVSYETDDASRGFDAFSIVAVGALLAVGEQIESLIAGPIIKLKNGVLSLGDKAIFQPIRDGFAEYETQMGAIQTIMANTGRDFNSSSDIAQVNEALDKLNVYADKTIYNFTEMTRNIGTFTAAGVSMEEAVPAIQGIANMAALSGSTSHQASTAMYQLSQALAAGSVKLQDWNSVVNAGMGGQLFQNKLLEVAYHIHEANGQLDEYGEILDKVSDKSLSFRESLQEEWITSEVLTEALTQMTYSYDDMSKAEIEAAQAHLSSLNYNTEEIKSIFKLGQTAMESATKVRTWSQLWDTIGEALGSGWTTSWRIIIGDFKDATNLFTELSSVISGVIENVSGAQNAILQSWSDFTGRDQLFGFYEEDDETGETSLVKNGVLQNTLDTIRGWAKPISDAFSDVFNLFETNYDSELAQVIKSFGAGSDEVTNKYNELVSQAKQQFGEDSEEVATYVKLLDHTKELLDYDSDYAKIVKSFGASSTQAKDYRDEYLAPFVEQFGKDSDKYKAAMQTLKNSENLDFDPDTLLFDDVGAGLADITRQFNEFTATLIPTESMMTNIRRAFDGLFSVINLVITVVGSLFHVFTSLFSIVQKLTAPIVEIAFAIGGSLGSALSAISDYLIIITHAFSDFVDMVIDAVSPAIEGLVSGFFEMLDIPTKLQAVTNFFTTLIDVLFDLLDIPGKIRSFSDFLSGIVKSVSEFFGFVDASEKDAENKATGVLGIVQNFFGKIKSVLNKAFPFLQTIKNGISDFFKVFTEGTFEEGRQYILNLIETIKTALTPLADFGKAVIDLGGRIISGISEFEGLKVVGGAINDFIDSVTHIPESLFGIGKSFANEVSEMTTSSESFGTIGSNLTDLTNKINGITFDNVVTSFNNMKENVISGFTNFFNYITHTSPMQMIEDLANKIKEIGSNIVNALRGMFPTFDEFISNITSDDLDSKGPFIKFFGTLVKKAKAGRKELKAFAGNVKNMASSVSDAISQNEQFNNIIEAGRRVFDIFSNLISNSNIGGKLVEAFSEVHSLSDAFSKIATWFQTLTFDKLVGYFNKLLEKVREVINAVQNAIFDARDKILPIFESIGTKLGDFVSEVTDGAESIQDVVGNLRRIIEEKLSDLPKFFSEIFSSFKNDTFSVPEMHLDDSISMDENAIPNFFEQVIAAVKEWFGKFGETISNLPNTIVALPEMIADIFNENTASGSIKNFFDNLTNTFTDLDIPGKISKLFEDVANTFEDNQDVIGGLLIGGLLNQIRKFIKSFRKTTSSVGKSVSDFFGTLNTIGKSVSDLPTTVGKTMAEFSKEMKAFREETPAEALLKIAGAIGILALSLFILSTIPADDLIKAGQALGALALGLVAVITVISLMDKFKLTNAATLTAIGNAFSGMGIGLLALAGAMWVLSMIPAEGLEQAVDVLLAASVALVAIAEAIDGDKVGSQIFMAALGLLVLAFAMRAMIKTIEMWQDFDLLANAGGLLKMAIAIGILGLALRAAGPNALKAGAGFMLLAIAMALMIPAIAAIGALFIFFKDDIWYVVGGMAALAIFMVAMGGALRLAGENAIKAGAGFLLLSVAIGIIATSLAVMSLIAKPESLLALAGSIAVLMIIFGVIAKKVKPGELVKTAGALIVFGIAIAAMAAGLSILSNYDWTSIAAAGASLAVLMGVLAIITGNKNIEPGKLALISAGLIVFGIAVAAMAAGLSLLANFPVDGIAAAAIAIGGLVTVLAIITGLKVDPMSLIKLSAGLVIFGIAVAAMAVGLAQLAGFEPDHIAAAAIAIGALIAVLAIAAGILSTLPGVIPVLAMLSVAFIAVGVAAILIAQGLSIAVDALAKLVMLGPMLTLFVQMIAQNLGNFALAAVAFVALGAGLVILGAGLLVFGAGALVAGAGAMLLGTGLTVLVQGIISFMTLLIILPTLLTAVGEAWGSFFENIFNNLGGFVEGLGSWFTDTLLPALGEFFLGIWTWFTEDVLPGLGGMLSQFWNWVQNDGLPMLTEFFGGIFGGLGEFLGGVWEWIQNEGLPMLGQALSSFWNWVTTEGLPMLGNFIGEIFNSLGGLLGQLWNWVTTDGAAMVGDVIGHIMEAAGAIFDDLIEWASGIPDAIWEGLGDILEWAGNIGSDIVNGIVSGIESLPNAIGDALGGIATAGLNAVTGLLGINSPSRVFRDQVGQYIPAGIAAGIAKYSNSAIRASEELAEDVAQTARHNLDDVDFGLDLGYGNITPVLDMSDFNSSLNDYQDKVKDLDFTATAVNAQNIDANVDLSALLRTASEQTRQISELRSQNEGLLTELESMRNEMAEYNNIMRQTSIVMDTGTLVGVLAPGMDSALGRRQVFAERGVY